MQRLLALAMVALLALSACGEKAPAASTAPFPSLQEAMDCDGPGTFSEKNDGYDNGAVAQSAEGAVATAAGEGLFSGPRDGYRVAAEEEDRVLFVYEVDGEVKQAIETRYGPTVDETGWFVYRWAGCELSEFPPEVAQAQGTEVWSDADGQRVSTEKVQSYVGPEHCDWDDMTFLAIGKRTFVREPDAELRDYFEGEYVAHTSLPGNAEDTGYQHGEDHLWLAQDGDHAYIGDQADVEEWPRMVKPLYCD